MSAEGSSRADPQHRSVGFDGSGSYRAWSSRTGVDHVQVTLFRPGCSPRERRNARLWSARWTGAAVVWFVVLLVVVVFVREDIPDAVLGATAAGIAGVLFLWFCTRHRCAVLRLRADRWEGCERTDELEFQRLAVAGAAMEAADAALGRGDLTAAQREVFLLRLWNTLSGLPNRP